MHYRNQFLTITLLAASFLLRVSSAFSGEELTGADLTRARDVYNLKCVKCHQLRNVSDYDDKTWNKWMLKMKKKAHLKDKDFNLISAYTDKLRKTSKTVSEVSPNS